MTVDGKLFELWELYNQLEIDQIKRPIGFDLIFVTSAPTDAEAVDSGCFRAIDLRIRFPAAAMPSSAWALLTGLATPF